MSVVVRPYQSKDRAAVRHICCETGFMGDPVDPVFTDRDVFADFLTRYYTDCEPESALVAEADGRVVGYMTGCLRYRFYPIAQALILAAIVIPKVLLRIATFRYGRQNLRYLHWILRSGSAETPRKPSRSAHLHINLLPSWRDGKAARRLIFGFFRMARERGVRRIYGQLQSQGDRRPPKVFERYGYRMIDRRRVTKFKRFVDHEVYVTTFFKDYDED